LKIIQIFKRTSTLDGSGGQNAVGGSFRTYQLSHAAKHQTIPPRKRTLEPQKRRVYLEAAIP